MKARYQVIVYHGEVQSLWYIVDTLVHERMTPMVVATCHNPGQAAILTKKLNEAEE